MTDNGDVFAFGDAANDGDPAPYLPYGRRSPPLSTPRAEMATGFSSPTVRSIRTAMPSIWAARSARLSSRIPPERSLLPRMARGTRVTTSTERWYGYGNAPMAVACPRLSSNRGPSGASPTGECQSYPRVRVEAVGRWQTIHTIVPAPVFSRSIGLRPFGRARFHLTESDRVSLLRHAPTRSARPTPSQGGS